MAQDQNVNATYQYVVSLFQGACQSHRAIKSFDTGTIDFLDASSQNRVYPYVFLRPMSTAYTTGTRTLSYELYSLDIPKVKSQTNTEIISDTEMYVYDILAYFNFGTLPIDADINMTSCIPVNEGFQDRVYGWVASIDVEVPFALNFCDYPSYP